MARIDGNQPLKDAFGTSFDAAGHACERMFEWNKKYWFLCCTMRGLGHRGDDLENIADSVHWGKVRHEVELMRNTLRRIDW